ncbi:Ectoine-binding periplasmic protein TeaA [Granulosicoccus antarcticus IMCC3135]|uniref:Ectoine-binding periplasmic protein TeaA n=2 Tax=Granulosicoccus TaxID=437504 RepID=A0A2Z2NKK1_9GAMM|nr:Ectoine-binding periplasmic protein TeaA [Granulosicoccus antarcticus IMCC3135]
MFRSIAALMIATSPAMADNWDLPMAWPDGNFITTSAGTFADEVRVSTDGRVDITIHPGGSLGFKGPEMLGAVRDGLVPIADVFLPQQIGDEPLLGLPGLPFMFPSFDALESFDSFFREDLDEIMASHNQKVLFTIPWPAPQVWVDKEITDIESLAGIRVRTYDKTSTEVYGAAGMTPVQLPWGEVIPSLASGAIEGVVTSSSSAVDGSFWEFLSYGYPTAHSWNLDAMTVNLDSWNALSDEDQASISKIASDLQPAFWQAARAEDAQRMATLAEKGMTLGTVSAELHEALVSKAEPLRAEAIEKLGDKGKAIYEAYLATQ